MKKLYFLILILSLVLTGCRSSKKGLTTTIQDTELLSKYETVVEQPYNFETLQSKVKVGLGGKTLSGKFGVERGNRLYLTMTVLGAEVARVEANQERVYVVDKFDKVYAELTIAEAAAQFGLESEMRYDALEALLMGRMFLPGKGLSDKGDFNRFVWEKLDASATGTFAKDRYSLSYTIDADNHLRLTQVQVAERNSTFGCEYVGTQMVDGNLLMPSVVTLAAEGGSMDMQIELTLQSPQLNKKTVSPFSPNGYRKVSMEELVKMIKSK